MDAAAEVAPSKSASDGSIWRRNRASSSSVVGSVDSIVVKQSSASVLSDLRSLYGGGGPVLNLTGANRSSVLDGLSELPAPTSSLFSALRTNKPTWSQSSDVTPPSAVMPLPAPEPRPYLTSPWSPFTSQLAVNATSPARASTRLSPVSEARVVPKTLFQEPQDESHSSTAAEQATPTIVSRAVSDSSLLTSGRRGPGLRKRSTAAIPSDVSSQSLSDKQQATPATLSADVDVKTFASTQHEPVSAGLCLQRVLHWFTGA